MSIVKRDQEDPDSVWLVWDEEDFPEFGLKYEIIKVGFLWWKGYAIAYYLPNMSAPAVGGGSWVEVSRKFETKEEARAALYAGRFKRY